MVCLWQLFFVMCNILANNITSLQHFQYYFPAVTWFTESVECVSDSLMMKCAVLTDVTNGFFRSAHIPCWYIETGKPCYTYKLYS